MPRGTAVGNFLSQQRQFPTFHVVPEKKNQEAEIFWELWEKK